MNDEQLSAYLDGELDDAQRAQAEREIEADPALAERVRTQQALRTRLQAAYAPVLDEPLPERLLAATRSAQVVDLTAARKSRRRWGWPEWAAMAASVLAGVIGGRLLLDEPLQTRADGSVVARGMLARALDRQLAADTNVSDVRLATSFVARSGRYCRSFVLERTAPLAGVACREGDAWTLQALASAARGESTGGYRMATSALPAAVLKTIDEQINGAPLDAAGERAALERGWR
jgi:hypothetical protein